MSTSRQRIYPSTWSFDDLRLEYLPVVRSEIASNRPLPTIHRLEELGLHHLRPHILAHGGMQRVHTALGFWSNVHHAYEPIKHLCRGGYLATMDDLTGAGFPRLAMVIHQEIGTAVFAKATGLKMAHTRVLRQRQTLDRLLCALAIRLHRVPTSSDLGPRAKHLCRHYSIRTSIERSVLNIQQPVRRLALQVILAGQRRRSPIGYWHERRITKRLRPVIRDWVKAGCSPGLSEYVKKVGLTFLLRHMKEIGDTQSFLTNPLVATENEIHAWRLDFVRSEIRRVEPELAAQKIMPARRTFRPKAPRADTFILHHLGGYQATAQQLGYRRKRLAVNSQRWEKTVGVIAEFIISQNRLPEVCDLQKPDRLVVKRRGGAMQFLNQVAADMHTRPLVVALVEQCQAQYRRNSRSREQLSHLLTIANQLTSLINAHERRPSIP